MTNQEPDNEPNQDLETDPIEQPLTGILAKLKEMHQIPTEIFQQELKEAGSAKAWLTRHCPRAYASAATLLTETQLEALAPTQTQSFWTGIEARYRECSRCPEEGGECDGSSERISAGKLVRIQLIGTLLTEEKRDCQRYQDFVMARRLESAGVGSAMSRVKLSELGEIKPELLASFEAFVRSGYRRRAPRKVQLLIEGPRAREYGITLFRQVVKEYQGSSYHSTHIPTLARDAKDKMTAKEPSPFIELKDYDVLLLDAVEPSLIKPKSWFREELVWLYENRRDNGLATIITSTIACKEAFPGVSVLRV